jgi:hypothetical protein
MQTRFFRRIKINHEIKALAQDGFFIGRLKNISLGGLFIKTEKSISVGEQVEINIPLRSEFEMSNFAAELTAIRSEAEGVAFKFNQLDPKNFWTLQSFINYES